MQRIFLLLVRPYLLLDKLVLQINSTRLRPEQSVYGFTKSVNCSRHSQIMTSVITGSFVCILIKIRAIRLLTGTSLEH